MSWPALKVLFVGVGDRFLHTRRLCHSEDSYLSHHQRLGSRSDRSAVLLDAAVTSRLHIVAMWHAPAVILVMLLDATTLARANSEKTE